MFGFRIRSPCSVDATAMFPEIAKIYYEITNILKFVTNARGEAKDNRIHLPVVNESVAPSRLTSVNIKGSFTLYVFSGYDCDFSFRNK